jgi:hypothetical protein
LVLGNPQVGSVQATAKAGEGVVVEFSVIRPGYGPAAFAFRRDGRDLRLMLVAADGRAGDAPSLDDRRLANRLLIDVARAR